MAKRRKVQTIKLSLRLPEDVVAEVHRLAEASGLSDAKVAALLIRCGSFGLHGDPKTVFNMAREWARTLMAQAKVVKSNAAASEHRRAASMLMGAAIGVKPGKDVPPELAS